MNKTRKEKIAAMSNEGLLDLIVYLSYTAHIAELSEHPDRQTIADDLEGAKEEAAKRMS